MENGLKTEFFPDISNLSFAMKLVILKFSLIDVLIQHKLFTVNPLIILPRPLKLAPIWPHHSTLSIPLIELPGSLKFGHLIRHYNFIILVDIHLSLAISLTVLKVPSIDISSRVLSCSIAIDPAIDKLTIHDALGVLLGLEDAFLFILVLT
jgi:hypothetical protein